jgi:tryptophan 2,3-dioxygenase
MKNTYARYLQLERILSAQAQRTQSDDELLFIIIHQQHELWFKLAIHELDCAIKSLMREDASDGDCIIAFKRLSRVSAIQHVLISSWDVVGTLTPDEFTVFRETVGKDGASGFQSIQYRILEFKLGLRYRTIDFELPGGRTRTIDIFENVQTEEENRALRAALGAPGIYDAVIAFMARHLRVSGIEAPRSRDYSRPYRINAAVCEAWSFVYKNRAQAPELYQLGEKLIDLEDAFRRWRFVHAATVSRVIGSNTGTGGSTGLKYLTRAANQLFENPIYPELWDVRNEMFSQPRGFDLAAAGYDLRGGPSPRPNPSRFAGEEREGAKQGKRGTREAGNR